jgi:hypothetical protein
VAITMTCSTVGTCRNCRGWISSISNPLAIKTKMGLITSKYRKSNILVMVFKNCSMCNSPGLIN